MIILSVICGVISAACFVASAFQFAGKGPLLNNAYLYASEKEREKMDKKPYYRQSGVAFLLIGALFALNTVELAVRTGWMIYLITAAAAATIVYSIVSSLLISISNIDKTNFI